MEGNINSYSRVPGNVSEKAEKRRNLGMTVIRENSFP